MPILLLPRYLRNSRRFDIPWVCEVIFRTSKKHLVILITCEQWSFLNSQRSPENLIWWIIHRPPQMIQTKWESNCDYPIVRGTIFSQYGTCLHFLGDVTPPPGQPKGVLVYANSRIPSSVSYPESSASCSHTFTCLLLLVFVGWLLAEARPINNTHYTHSKSPGNILLLRDSASPERWHAWRAGGQYRLVRVRTPSPLKPHLLLDQPLWNCSISQQRQSLSLLRAHNSRLEEC